jgi:hypothetical protein
VSDRVVQTLRIHAVGRSAVLEVEIVEPQPPGGIRQRIALRLIQLAGRLVRMRVRIVGPPLLTPRDLASDALASQDDRAG